MRRILRDVLPPGLAQAAIEDRASAWMRSPALTRYAGRLAGKDYKTVTLDRPGRFGQPARPGCTRHPPCG